MAPDTEHDALVADLAALGSALPQPTPGPGLTVAVMARLPDGPTPTAPSRLRRPLRAVADAVARRRRRVAVVATALVLTLLTVPPVRAAVVDWFGFAGVIVRHGPAPGPSVAPPPPTAGTTTGLDQAKELLAFNPMVPAALGSPQGVEVSADRRLLSMSWTNQGAGVVRLDQFDGRLDYVFAKTATGAEYTSVDGSFALWFDRPHEVVVLNSDGTRRTETARLAGNTLIWERGETALRLEGDLSLARAIEIARSVAEVG
jgi:hypothetical protein